MSKKLGENRTAARSSGRSLEPFTRQLPPNRLSTYFRREWLPLMIVTVSGLIYNVGLTAGPYFEGQLAQKLYDIIGGTAAYPEMVTLALHYLAVILLVQGMRCLKRFYVRRFANDTSRSMRQVLYNHLVHQSRQSLEQESVGTLMTKAIADVDACAEGMRKFTTELFDTGIALVAYLGMMLLYDWRLTLLSCLLIPAAYGIAEKMKVVVYRCNSACKKSAGALNDATLDRVSAAMTYRVFGQEQQRNEAYEKHLSHYEQSAVRANLWENALPPIYQMISMIGVIFILYFGGKNVLGTGYRAWDIAAFTAFLSCFGKMAVKSSKAAKLFNSVQKAQVSWKRIQPLMKPPEEVDSRTTLDVTAPVELAVKNVGVSYEGKGASGLEQTPVFSGLSFEARPGDVIGITGPVACGKSTLGRVFLGELLYEGSITLNGRELTSYTPYERNHLISYLGHQPELMSDSIENNICYGEKKDCLPFLKAVCLEQEIKEMPQGLQTEIGSHGTRLSGGQQDRLALARTLYHGRKLFVLDDPFSAVDQKTERQILETIRKQLPDAIFLLISHRVTMFPEFTRVLWMQDGRAVVGTHAELLEKEARYRESFAAQQAGGDLDEK